MPAAVGLAWVVGLSALAALVALSHDLKKSLRVERRNQEHAAEGRRADLPAHPRRRQMMA
jgi:hypothetical protein